MPKTQMFVIVDRTREGVGLARSHQTLEEATRNRDALSRHYPDHAYSIEPQRNDRRGRIIYPTV